MLLQCEVASSAIKGNTGATEPRKKAPNWTRVELVALRGGAPAGPWSGRRWGGGEERNVINRER